MKRTSFAVLTVLFLSGSAQAAGPYADHVAAKKAIKDAADHAGIPAYERTLPTGETRVELNPHTYQQVAALSTELSRGSNVLEIMQHQGVVHTKAVFDRELVHTQYQTGTSNWRLRRWGGSLQLTDHTLYSALIQLTPGEAEKLRGLLVAAWQEEGPEATAGDKWEKGHLTAALGRRNLNCVSTWTEMPIGEHGEPLWKLLGLPMSYSGNPGGLQQALETQGNSKVLGTAIYGPKVEGFGANASARLVM